MFTLIDGNNFYCACERVFQPGLRGRPLVVLSNNDGCAVARSNEAKALGIRMGTPYFKIRHLEQSAGLIALSSNYPLYGEMSSRMMAIAATLGPRQEVYSIDETFVDLNGLPRTELTQRAQVIRQRIERWIGIPCGVGIGPTKTLAKLANHVAKSAERQPGSYPAGLAQVCNLATLPPHDFEAVLAATPLAEIWGVGPRIGAQLQAAGLRSARDLAQMDPSVARRGWSVMLERTVRELHGQACIELDSAPAAQREIACTRSFGQPIDAIHPILEAVSSYATRAAEKLRRQHSLSSQVMVFVHTSAHGPTPQYARSIVMPLRRPTAHTMTIVHAACTGLQRIFAPGHPFIKAGVILLELTPASQQQAELALQQSGDPVPLENRLMATLDAINQRHGQGTLRLASSGLGSGQRWQMKQQRRSPDYLADWQALPTARA
jgi:DNA polymerase V